MPTGNKDVIKLETLRKEYDIIFAQYQEAQKTYINNLQSPPTDGQSTDSYTITPGSMVMPSSRSRDGITISATDSVASCQDMCVSNEKCAAASYVPFNANVKLCYQSTPTDKTDLTLIRSMGSGTGGPISQTWVSIIPTLTANNLILQSLNDSLTSITTKINQLIADAAPELTQLYDEKATQQIELNDVYQKLLDEKVQLLSEIEEYNTITETINDKELIVNRENGMFRFWIIITLIVLIIVIKQLFGLENSMSTIIWLVIIILIIILTYSLKTPTGFLIWGLALLAVIYTRS